MLKKMQILTFLIIITILSSSLGIISFASNTNDFVVENGVLRSYKGTSQDVLIPGDLGIYAIGNAFKYNNNIHSVAIPTGVTDIADEAFIYCKNLTTVGFPEGLKTIGDNAFNNCTSLKSIVLPSSITSIGNSAFADCTSMNNVTLPDNIAKLGIGVFANTTIPHTIIIKQNSILCYVPNSFSSYTIPDSVTQIKGGAFATCSNLKSLVIPYGIAEIEASTFVNCTALNTVSIPDSVILIGDFAFSGCKNLMTLDIPKNTTLGFRVFNDCGLKTTVFTNDGKTLYFVPLDTKGYNVPDYVQEIASFAFYDCQEISSVKLPNGLVSIGSFTFSRCRSLESVIIPNSVTVFGYWSFAADINLKSIYIPNSKTTFNTGVFDGDKNLTINAYTLSTAESYAKDNNISFDSIDKTAQQSNSSVVINGKSVGFQAYTIKENNYFKLRDLALALNGTNKEFNVGWDGTNNAIAITTNTAYTPVGGELINSGISTSMLATLSSAQVYINGKAMNLTAYTINGNNFFKLRDIGQALNFGVTWDDSSNTIKIDTSTGYTP